MSLVQPRGFKYWSPQHIDGAATLIGLLAQMEPSAETIKGDAQKGKYVDLVRYRALAISTVFSAVAFLETTINELYAESADDTLGVVRGLNRIDRLALARAKPLVLEHRGISILEKFQMALILAHRPEMDRGAQPFQDADIVIKLRNELLHYAPEWTGVKPDRFVLMLRNKFALSPMEADGIGPEYLDRYIGLGLAHWAFDTSLEFADAFFAKLGIQGFYQRAVPQARTLLPS